MSEESDGSIRLLDFIPMLIDLRLNESVYLVDEIDRSMHPMLSKKLLEYYFKHLSNERDTQLIFSTHESNLLDLDLIRADEVWFVEKDMKEHLTSLRLPNTSPEKIFVKVIYKADMVQYLSLRLSAV